MKPHAYLFVDGSASSKDEFGAWTAFAVTRTERKLLIGATAPTTISRCELAPIVEGLRWIGTNWAKRAPGFRVTVYSDSEYTVKTLCGIYPRRKHLDLWAALDAAVDGLQVEYRWRERNSLPYMVLCDAVCGGLRRVTMQTIRKYFQDEKEPEKIIPFGELPGEIEDT